MALTNFKQTEIKIFYLDILQYVLYQIDMLSIYTSLKENTRKNSDTLSPKSVWTVIVWSAFLMILTNFK